MQGASWQCRVEDLSPEHTGSVPPTLPADMKEGMKRLSGYPGCSELLSASAIPPASCVGPPTPSQHGKQQHTGAQIRAFISLLAAF